MTIKMDIIKAMRFREDDDSPLSSSVNPKIPFYDGEEGKYRIDGGVVVDNVQFRAGTKRNIVRTIGLKVTRFEEVDGEYIPVETLNVTKEEALALALQYGLRNAYVRTAVKKDKETGEDYLVHYPYPYPTTEESFTRDDRLVFVYEVNEDGKKVKPLNIVMREVECSVSLWAIIESDYERREGVSKVKRGRKELEDKRIVQEIRTNLKLGRYNITNPYTEGR